MIGPERQPCGCVYYGAFGDGPVDRCAAHRSTPRCAPLCGASRAYGRFERWWHHEPDCPVRIAAGGILHPPLPPTDAEPERDSERGPAVDGPHTYTYTGAASREAALHSNTLVGVTPSVTCHGEASLDRGILVGPLYTQGVENRYMVGEENSLSDIDYTKLRRAAAVAAGLPREREESDEAYDRRIGRILGFGGTHERTAEYRQLANRPGNEVRRGSPNDGRY